MGGRVGRWWRRITDELVDAGTFVRLNPDRKPDSFWCRSDPSDVARVEDRTFICSRDPGDAGVTNNWEDPDEMKRVLTGLFRDCMRGRTMYVIPYCMGPLTAPEPMLGVELTDSPYVVASMHITDPLRIAGNGAPREMIASSCPGCTVSVRRWHLARRTGRGRATPRSTSRTSRRSAWSGPTAPGTAATRCWARSATRCGSPRLSPVSRVGWPSTCCLPSSPRRRSAATTSRPHFPSACGKTNLAMLEPTLPGWRVETLGDDIAWIRVGPDGRLHALNPEKGLFGVAPGTGWHTNPNAMRTIAAGHSIFTNVALTDDGDVWWEGMTEEPPAHLTDWRGQSWTPESGTSGGARQCPVLHADRAVPHPRHRVGRPHRRTAGRDLLRRPAPRHRPTGRQARDWQHGVFLAATLSSETTAAASGHVGLVRRDPMAMLPFIGYNAGDYFAHWIEVGKSHDAAKLPAIFYVNWFRRDADGRFLWPGFGDNIRVLKWALQRLSRPDRGNRHTRRPYPDAGCRSTPRDSTSPPRNSLPALAVDPIEWRIEVPAIRAGSIRSARDCPHRCTSSSMPFDNASA